MFMVPAHGDTPMKATTSSSTLLHRGHNQDTIPKFPVFAPIIWPLSRCPTKKEVENLSSKLSRSELWMRLKELDWNDR
jgi:hypothetical protein